MLEITHRQAQFLIRESLDARPGDGRMLPEEQWAALQAHLESCSDCRAYRDGWIEMEKRLRRSLSARWEALPGPHPQMAARLAGMRRAARQRRERRLAWARRSTTIGLGVLVGLALFLRVLPAALAPAPVPTPTPTPLPQPAPSPPAWFNGVVLFEARLPGQASEIFLLRSNGEQVEVSNLTRHPAADTDPAWSPDGAWVAFFSDRSGRRELYVMSVAGSRVTMLTDAPGIAWGSALAWSPDGNWIALSGERAALGDLPWVYAVPLEGGGARPLPGTRGVSGPLRFAASTGRTETSLVYALAETDAPVRAGLGRYRYGSTSMGQTDLLTDWVSRPTGVFDFRYRVGIGELVYLNGPGSSEIQRMLDHPDLGLLSYLLEWSENGAYRGIAFVPGEKRIAYLFDADGSGCWTVHLRQADALNAQVERVEGLCVEDALEPQQWARESRMSGGGAWAVARARLPGERSDGLYVLRAPSPEESGSAASFYSLPLPARLELAGAPRAQPLASPLAIDPAPARPPPDPLPEASLPVGLEGQIAFSVQEGPDASRIESAGPGMEGRTELAPSEARVACPTLSPDGAQVAFLSNRQVGRESRSELFLLDIERRLPVRLSLSHLAAASYDCPVWSPDGSLVAVVARASGQAYLAVFPTGGGRPDSLAIEESSRYASPAWLPGSRTVLLPVPRRIGSAPYIGVYHWRDDQVLASPRIFTEVNGWDDFQALSVSPDGTQLAALLVRDSPWPGEIPAELRVFDTESGSIHYSKELTGYKTGAIPRPGRIFWLNDGQIAFPFYGDPLSEYRSALVRYDPATDTIQYLAQPEDRLLDWGLNDGWLLYATESGLYGLNLIGRLDARFAPLRLAEEIIPDLDWK